MTRQTSRLTAALFLLVLVSLQAVSARSLSETSSRALLAASPSSSSGDSPQTCCNCKCVMPSPQRASCKPGTLCGTAQSLPPTYSKKKICKNGFAKSCDDVCLVDRGSWTEYNTC